MENKNSNYYEEIYCAKCDALIGYSQMETSESPIISWLLCLECKVREQKKESLESG